MNDKKQIEKMAKVLCGITKECRKCKLNGKCLSYNSAELIYNAGYRKIPEGALVILDEEMEAFAKDFANSPQTQEVMNGLIKAWQKETAEKFYNSVKEKIEQIEKFYFDNGKIGYNGLTVKELNKLAKQFGVEEEE